MDERYTVRLLDTSGDGEASIKRAKSYTDLEDALNAVQTLAEFSNFEDESIELAGGDSVTAWLDQLKAQSEDTVEHTFEPGDYALDATEPTPSPEVNTVKVVDVLDKRADEHTIVETGKTVAEHNPAYPADDPVVLGRYPNMSSDKTWHFPESRLQRV